MGARLLALSICLAGLLSATGRVFTATIAVPIAPTRIVTHLSGDAVGWDVETGYDPIRCEIYCVYRQRNIGPQRTLPPVATVEVYSGPSATPRVITVDPAGARFPAVSRDERIAPERAVISSPRALEITLRVVSEDPGAVDSPAPRRTAPERAFATPVIFLRI